MDVARLPRRLSVKRDLANLERPAPIRDELFPLEQHRIVSFLVERVEVQEDGLVVRLRGDGPRSLVAELGDEKPEAQVGSAGHPRSSMTVAG